MAGGGENGITDFNRLHSRTHDALAYAYAFDLLAIDGTDTRALPLSERKAALAHLLRKAKPGIRYTEHLVGDGRIIFERACMMGLEGIVSKRLNSPYRSGKTKAWVKLKDFEIVHIYAGIMRPYERSLRVLHTSRVAACPEWKR